jgi:hypothetical protein
MKTVLQGVFLLFIFTIASFAQNLPNAGFESWTSGNPDSWTTDNVVGFAVPVTQSNESHGGSSAAKLEVIDFSGQGYPAALTFTGAVSFTQLPANFSFYYKLAVQGNDALLVSIVLYKGEISAAVAAGHATISGNTSGYTLQTIPLEYYSSETPDNAYIIFGVGDTSNGETAGTIGSYALIDDVSLEGVTSVDNNNIVKKFELQQNYPNPFNPETKFKYSIQQQGAASLKIYDILGNEAAVVFNEEKEPGEYSVSFNAMGLSSGVYFAKLTSGNRQMIKKIILMK